MIKDDKTKDSCPQFKKKPPSRNKGGLNQNKSYESRRLKFNNKSVLTLN
jgi:hypothetical protein